MGTPVPSSPLVVPTGDCGNLHATRDRLIETIRSLDSRGGYRLLLYEGRIDPTQIATAPEELAAANVLLDLHDHLDLKSPPEAGQGDRVLPWIRSLRRGLAPLLDLLYSLQKGSRP